jgi:hypothetical protein
MKPNGQSSASLDRYDAKSGQRVRLSDELIALEMDGKFIGAGCG